MSKTLITLRKLKMRSRRIYLSNILRDFTLKRFSSASQIRSGVIKYVRKKSTRCQEYKMLVPLLSAKRESVTHSVTQSVGWLAGWLAGWLVG